MPVKQTDCVSQSVFFMSSISILLHRVHKIVHDSRMKPRFTEPKLYTGGVDVSGWSRLSKSDKEKALLKDWYIYYSFEDPDTGKLKRQQNIKAGANLFKTKKQRFEFLDTMRENLSIFLNKGFNPYEAHGKTDEEVLEVIFGVQDSGATISTKTFQPVPSSLPSKRSVSIKTALTLGLDTKKRVLSENSYPQFRSRVNQFKKWLKQNNYLEKDDILNINKNVVVEYLNSVLQNTSARTRNNARTDLGSLFQVLEDNEIIAENFVKKINVLKSTPVRNKTYTPVQENEILEYIQKTDKILLLFVKFISYNFLRPIELCRLRIEDIDVLDKKLYFKAKNAAVKIKIIPEILINEMPDISNLPKENYLFTPDGIGMTWIATESSKRDYFSKQFKKVKDHFGLGTEYGLYSFRHTYITKLYREFVKTMTSHEAESKLMLITGHSTIDALRSYLRDIDAVLPEDYSEYLN